MNLYELFVKISANTKALDDALNKSSGMVSKFGSAMKAGLGIAAKATGAAAVAAAGAVTAITKQSIAAYAEFQQLEGGVQKLYGNMGKSLQDYAAMQNKTTEQVQAEYERNAKAEAMIMENAKNAYKTASMSTNDYLDTATSFSASLISSLDGDTKKAAELTDVAMRSIADNYNTFGGDIENVKNAYKGFAKANYTMLDNLKLGYGGTKEEMARLIEDANEYGKSIGLAGDLSMKSFADIVTAIDLIQQKQKIAGTTEREAATTIEGSLNMAKAAWENLVAGMSNDEADFGKLIDNFVESADTAAKNVLPRIEVALNGVTKLITNLAPKLAEKLPGLISTILPGVLTAVVEIIKALGEALPGLITELLPQLIDAIMEIANGLAEVIPELIVQLVDMLPTVLPQLLDGIEQLIAVLTNALSEIAPEIIPPILQTIRSMWDVLLNNAEFVGTAVIGFMGVLTQAIVDNLPVLIDTINYVIGGYFDFIVEMWGTGKAQAAFEEAFVNPIKSSFEENYESIKEKFLGLFDFITDNNIFNLINKKFIEIGSHIVEGIWNGIKNAFPKLNTNFTKTIDSLIGKAKNVLGIHSPSKVFAEIGGYMAEGMGVGYDKAFAGVKKNITDTLDFGASDVIAPSAMATGNSAVLSAIGSLNEAISGMDVNVSLEGDAGKLFNMIKTQNSNNTKRMGRAVLV